MSGRMKQAMMWAAMITGSEAMAYDLELLGPQPGTAGAVNSFRVRGATPGAPVGLVVGLGGPFVIGAGNCAGTVLETGTPKLRAPGTANATGGAQIDVSLPIAASDRIVFFQAIALDTCEVSNPVAYNFATGQVVGIGGPVVAGCYVFPDTAYNDTELEAEFDVINGTCNSPGVTCGVRWQQRFGPVWAGIPGQSSRVLLSCLDRSQPGSTFNCGVGSNLRAVCAIDNQTTAFTSEAASDAVTIQNTPPIVTACTVSPIANNDLLASATTEDIDPNDQAAIAFSWSVSGAVVASTSDVLPASAFASGDVVTLVCTAIDTNGGVSVPVSTSLLIP